MQNEPPNSTNQTTDEPRTFHAYTFAIENQGSWFRFEHFDTGRQFDMSELEARDFCTWLTAALIDDNQTTDSGAVAPTPGGAAAALTGPSNPGLTTAAGGNPKGEDKIAAQRTVETVARAIAKRALEYSYSPNISRPVVEVENHFLRDRARWMAEAEAAIGCMNVSR